MKMKLFLILLLLCLAYGTLSVSVSMPNSIELYTEEEDSPALSYGYMRVMSRFNCTFTLVISSTCSAPNFTMEHISIRFGDIDGKQVRGPILSLPCWTDDQGSWEIFEINGACPSPICYLQLYRHGESDDGYWNIETLQIFGNKKPILTFKFEDFSPIPIQTWFGYNICHTIDSHLLNITFGDKVIVLLFFWLSSKLTLSVSESKSDSFQYSATAAESFSFGPIQMKTSANCSYRVVISTSCSSPNFTTEEIGIAFGDVYGNKIYEPRLNDPISRTFERCSLDTFHINGACASPICYVFLHRPGAAEGRDWMPEIVKIYGKNNTRPLAFNFSIPPPTHLHLYGYDWCDPDHLFNKWLSPLKWVFG
ncbi:hypothetical protein VNO78_32699 [Psophocarpus tetragonolobus]|uniref:Uncharacterized protein n=1 Tax=Psophocarpus tetragonolobus TaxID=3891 RepID=A0AAN9NWM5_PSOTE